jgi:hypothetical protein
VEIEETTLVSIAGWLTSFCKAAAFAAVEAADPLGLEDPQQAAEEFRAKILRLSGEAPEAS